MPDPQLGAGPPVVQIVSGSGNIFSGTGDVYQITYHLPAAEAEERRGLLLLLQRVRSFWIEGVLEHSLHRMALLALGRTAVQDAVEHPWERVLALPDQTDRALGADASVGAIFEDSARLLLILGEPGSGKTTTLLELARDLLSRAEHDPTEPVPAVFSLSAWSNPRQPLHEWLADELSTKYQIPRSLGREWLARRRLLPLLDGLDEIPADRRPSCVAAIHDFLEQVGAPGVAITCRLHEYQSLPVRLRLHGAICLQPLAPDRIDAHLAQGGDSLSALRIVVREDPILAELARSPLMLSVMTLAYADRPVEALYGTELDTAEERRDHVFAAYVERMFAQRGRGRLSCSGEQVRHWLSILARQLSEDGRQVFLLEQLQPTWLATARERWRYLFLSRLFAVTILVIGTFLVTYTSNLADHLNWSVYRDWKLLPAMLDAMDHWFAGVVTRVADPALVFHLSEAAPALSWIPAGVVAVLILAPIATIADGASSSAGIAGSPGARIRRVLTASIYPLVLPMAILIAYQAIQIPSLLLLPEGWPAVIQWFWIQPAYSIWAPVGVFWGALLAYRTGLRPLGEDVTPVEVLSWSWIGCVRGALIGGAWGIIVAVLQFSIYFQLWEGEGVGSVLADDADTITGGGMLGAVVGGLIGALLGGFRPRPVEHRIVLNEGIRRSLRSAAVGGAAAALGCAALGWLWGWWLERIGDPRTLEEAQSTARTMMLLWGLAGALYGSLWHGGTEVIRHYTLRWVLQRSGRAPRNYRRFLEDATRLAFLQRVGGGYRFVHRLLQEHFAGRCEPAGERTAAGGVGAPPRPGGA